MQDLYKTLGVSPSASEGEIKKAYRSLAMRYHPDRAKDAQQKKEFSEKFREINAAYDILKEPQKRQQYDTTGSTDGRSSFNARDFQNAFRGSANFESFFSDIFNTQKAKSPITLRIDVTLLEVKSKSQVSTSYVSKSICSSCDGIGSLNPIVCPRCKGRGVVGDFIFAAVCPICKGRKRVSNPKSICQKCNGNGEITSKKSLKFNIPAGVTNGDVLRVENNGDELHVKISFKKHPVFSVHQHDLKQTAYVPFKDMCLGGSVSVRTVDNQSYKIKIKPGTSCGLIYRCKNLGLPINSLQNGDMYVQVFVDIPTTVSPEQRSIIEKLKM